MKKDITITLAVQIFVMISVLLSYKLAMSFYSESGFSEYSLIKRNVALINPLIMLGLGTALTRYIALSIEKNKKIHHYFISSFFFMILSFIFLGIFTTIFSSYASIILYGNEKYIKFLFPMYLTLLGLSLHVLVYSYFRGKLEMTKANILQLINLGIIPLLGFYFSNSAEEVYYYAGILSILFLTPIIIKLLYQNKFVFSDIFLNTKQLLLYGIQRVPGDFGIMALFSLPVLIATHIYGIEIGGYTAFGIAMLNMSGQAVAPLGVIFLPKISQLIAKKEFDIIRIYVKKLFFLSLGISFILMSLFYLFTEDILKLYLGYVNNDLLNITRGIALGIVGYMLYVTLRGVIDAYHEKGINTINIIVGLCCTGVIYIVLYITGQLTSINYIIYSFLIGIFIITILTLFTINRSIRMSK